MSEMSRCFEIKRGGGNQVEFRVVQSAAARFMLPRNEMLLHCTRLIIVSFDLLVLPDR
jgi:hypothetical protein